MGQKAPDIAAGIACFIFFYCQRGKIRFGSCIIDSIVRIVPPALCPVSLEIVAVILAGGLKNEVVSGPSDYKGSGR